ncbi:MAG: FAD:protein FMN transferase [Streptococcaceae bacterium]|jgi:thiamine biosynthesis lipoprotein|nr:FAD:protein FMN transferase [Streptococcaceae bacterium]
MKKRTSILLFLALMTLVFAGCQKKADLLKEPIKDEQFNVGTYVTISIYDKGKENALQDAFKLITELQALIEVNEEGISNIDEVNANSGLKPTKVDPRIFSLVKSAKEEAEATNGAFDPAIGAITHLWHIGFPDAKKPDEKDIQSRLGLVDYRDIELNDEAKTIYLTKKGINLDLGGIAKGFIAEQAIEQLKKQGVTTAILDLGGHVFTIGENPKSESGEWKIDIKNPTEKASTGEKDAESVGTYTGKNSVFITTSKYERYLLVGDTLYSHLMDPKTGWPYENDLVAATVVGDNAVKEDALSNALYDMGLKDGLDYANKNDLMAIFLTKDKTAYVSNAIKEHYEHNSKSSYKVEK